MITGDDLRALAEQVDDLLDVDKYGFSTKYPKHHMWGDSAKKALGALAKAVDETKCIHGNNLYVCGCGRPAGRG